MSSPGRSSPCPMSSSADKTNAFYAAVFAFHGRDRNGNAGGRDEMPGARAEPDRRRRRGGPRLPFCDGAFDVVVASEVLEHLDAALAGWFVSEVDARRARVVRRGMGRLRCNERTSGLLKRTGWRIEQVVGSPLRGRALWPAA